MDRDDKIKRAMEDFKDYQPTEEQIEIINQFAEDYSDKSEEDIFVEIINLNEKMEAEMDPDEYEAIFEKLESIRPFLDEEQEEKLDRILKALGKK
ncbi:MAG: hypothetical protein GX080_05540 [Tissierellia bacterium]|nr:hypothetical protein [Tissierellia bacterium]